MLRLPNNVFRRSAPGRSSASRRSGVEPMAGLFPSRMHKGFGISAVIRWLKRIQRLERNSRRLKGNRKSRVSVGPKAPLKSWEPMAVLYVLAKPHRRNTCNQARHS